MSVMSTRALWFSFHNCDVPVDRKIASRAGRPRLVNGNALVGSSLPKWNSQKREGPHSGTKPTIAQRALWLLLAGGIVRG